MTANTTGPVLCPSARGEPGALLLGRLGDDGLIAIAAAPFAIGETFVEAAGEGAERRFRFAAPCQGSRCAQWTGSRCGVLDRVGPWLESMGATPDAGPPDCAIRTACRWRRQSGLEACRICRFVVTEGDTAEADAEPVLTFA